MLRTVQAHLFDQDIDRLNQPDTATESVVEEDWVGANVGTRDIEELKLPIFGLDVPAEVIEVGIIEPSATRVLFDGEIEGWVLLADYVDVLSLVKPGVSLLNLALVEERLHGEWEFRPSVLIIAFVVDNYFKCVLGLD